MKTIIVLLTAFVAVGCAHGGGREANASAQAQTAEDEANLAAALSGRTAGPPQECVAESDLGGSQFYGTGVILFRSRTDDVVYVNRLPTGCPILGSGRAVKAKTPATRLCRGDAVTVFDPFSGIGYGGCSLGEFTPYRRSP